MTKILLCFLCGWQTCIDYNKGGFFFDLKILIPPAELVDLFR